jgi:FAD/FMN-containing dehydrogenase
MGLTGVIVEATLTLMPIRSSLIDRTTIKCASLDEALACLEGARDFTYSVAWIDCQATGGRMGRSLITLGEHATDGELSVPRRKALSIPFDFPGRLLDSWSIGAFNALYYNRVRATRSHRRFDYERFFYPLDRISDWNRLYGKGGFTQYQFVVPKAAGPGSLKAILGRIAASGRGSFLAVLKLLGPENANYLSFPLEGYTLALDFKLEPGLLDLLDELDSMVFDQGGRLYLAKDCRLSERGFKRSYPRWEAFQAVREKYGACGVFRSLQSDRLGLG